MLEEIPEMQLRMDNTQYPVENLKGKWRDFDPTFDDSYSGKFIFVNAVPADNLESNPYGSFIYSEINSNSSLHLYNRFCKIAKSDPSFDDRLDFIPFAHGSLILKDKRILYSGRKYPVGDLNLEVIEPIIERFCDSINFDTSSNLE